MISSDIVSLETYFKGLVTEDPELGSHVLETSGNPFELEHFESSSRLDGFQYPALIQLLPIISGSDNAMHNFEAEQEVAFCVLYPTDNSQEQKVDRHKKAQLAAWRMIKALRRDSKVGKFRLDPVAYKMAPIEYGTDNCVGQYVIITLITGTNSLIGV